MHYAKGFRAAVIIWAAVLGIIAGCEQPATTAKKQQTTPEYAPQQSQKTNTQKPAIQKYEQKVGFGKKEAETIKVEVDPSLTTHELPRIRGAMTEWMYDESAMKTTDPRGVKFGYGNLHPLKKEDIALAARTGLNTIRCSVSHTSLEERDNPGQYKEEGFARINQLLQWYDEYGLKTILDLHNALGREGGGDPRLWQQSEYQDRFCGIWKELARRYKGNPTVIAYEPLNEPEPRYTDDIRQCYAVWNNLAKRVTKAIRQVDPDKPIIIDCIEYAHPSAFEGLEPTGDDNSIYSFHWYYPYPFHCQKRPFIDDANTYHYPGEFDGKWWNRQTLRELMDFPLDFAAKNNVRLFCGEFGCVSDTPPMEDILWLMDLISLFDEHRIDWTYYHFMFRTPEPYWRDHFDCNMFIRDVVNNRLRKFGPKVSLLSDLMKLKGSFIPVEQPQDQWVTVYAVKEPDGNVRIYVWNKSRRDKKTVKIKLNDNNLPKQAQTQQMSRGSDGFVDVSDAEIVQGEIQLNLEPLTITRLRIEP